jgi:hypothetical protein
MIREPALTVQPAALSYLREAAPARGQMLGCHTRSRALELLLHLQARSGVRTIQILLGELFKWLFVKSSG